MENHKQKLDHAIEIDSLFVPLDGSEWHERAISYGLLLSRWFGATLDLFFSLADVPPLTRHGEWRQRAHLSIETGEDSRNLGESFINNGAIHEFGKILANDYLNEITRLLEPLGVDVATDLSAGSPAHILSYKAKQADKSMIVMYAHPQHRLFRYAHKKMAEELLGVTTSPILMINNNPDTDMRESQISPPSVIVPLRVENAMKVALPYAVAIAQNANAEIRLFESNLDYRQNRKLFDQARHFALAYLDQSNVEYAIRSINLGTTDTLAVAHRHSPYSWIVMGSRMRRGFTRRFFPSVADNIRREVTCPVLVVPQEEIIPKREQQLNRWLIEWLADQDGYMHPNTRIPGHARQLSLSQRFSSLYTYGRRNDEVERTRKNE